MDRHGNSNKNSRRGIVFLKLIRDEAGGLSVQWLTLLVISGIVGVLIMGALLGPTKEAYEIITSRSTDIMGTGF